MITKPMDVLENYQVRKSKKQKKAFTGAVTEYAQGLNYTVCVEKGSLGSRNIVIGDAANAKYLVTAHYDTCAWMPVPNFITPCNFIAYLLWQILLTFGIFAVAFGLSLGVSLLVNAPGLGMGLFLVLLYGILGCLLFGPANRHTANDNTSGVVTVLEIMASMPDNLKDRVAFVLFDLEEAGLVGSASYRSAHKQQTNQQIILNLDCVGDGNEVLFFPTKKLRKNASKMEILCRAEGRWGSKSIEVKEKGFSFYPSDQASFPYGVGIAAFHRAKWLGPYCSRIHTHRDTVLEQTNVNLLRAAIISLIGNDLE